MNILIGFLLFVFVVVGLLLILAILMQRSKQDGLGAAFGGGLTETVFGAQTSSVLVRFTSWLIGLFFATAITLAWLYGHAQREKSDLYKRLHPEAAPAASAPAVLTPAPAEPAAPAPASSPAPTPAPAPAH
jgi:preprotein translocase subunit SecG